ncbi:hypothetical protein SUGI_0195420 [Cryptomeria japonica]|uniref:subtilisin-like protease SBT1.7 n=1 Tax=Cryptomeria japonica TaxID=3369 RepID=UPI002408D1A5|nr:subtilisin-like protease SBT1.7 [Cryptomeria japonica]GLJ12664.1 hypothetical protein SUGI_0195420 [Cryptomeria japonica]
MKISGYGSIWLLWLFPLVAIANASSLEDGSLQTYIVQTSDSKMPSTFGNPEGWYSSLVDSLHGLDEDQDGSQSILYNYNQVFHGFAAKLTRAQAKALEKTDGILAVNPEMTYQLHTTRTPQFLGLNAQNGAWNSQSGKSDNIIIGLLDSGIWPESPSFSDYGMKPVPVHWKGGCESGTNFSASHCNKKLVGARFFSRGYEASSGPINETVEYRSPRDQAGHGTHTASTAAGGFVQNASFFGLASGTASGMAPTARIAVYKVCWARGCVSSDILAAMDKAVEDGVDIMSLSLGGKQTVGYESDSVAVGAFTAMQKGVFVSCSAGNSGPDQLSVENMAPWITTVGASTVDRDFPGSVVLGNGARFSGVSLYAGRMLPKGKLFPLVYIINGTDDSNLCLDGSLDPNLVKGKIVMCDRGTNSRVAKGFVVKSAGGVGMIMANTEGEDLSADSHVIPAIGVGAQARKSILNYIKTNGAPSATIELMGTVVGTRPAPVIAGFSSRGPSFLSPQILKPDIIAPGVNILAAWTGASGPSSLDIDTRRVKFNIISGTSMSCPHVSGIAALIKAAHPDWSPAAIRSALMTTANSVDNTGKALKDADSGADSTPFAHGAGHVDPNRALTPGLVYDMGVQDYVDFLCSLNYTPEQLRLITKMNAHCSSKSHLGSINYPSFAVVFTNSDTNSSTQVLKFSRTLTNVEDGASVYSVLVSAPAGVRVVVKPTKLSFAKRNEKVSYTVTFIAATSELAPSHGSITWSNGVRNVRSPVVAFSWQS